MLTKIRARQHQLGILLWGSDYMDPNSNAQTFCENTDNADNSLNRTSAWQMRLAGQGPDRAVARRGARAGRGQAGAAMYEPCSAT